MISIISKKAHNLVYLFCCWDFKISALIFYFWIFSLFFAVFHFLNFCTFQYHNLISWYFFQNYFLAFAQSSSIVPLMPLSPSSSSTSMLNTDSILSSLAPSNTYCTSEPEFCLETWVSLPFSTTASLLISADILVLLSSNPTVFVLIVYL